ncbi:MAG: serine/threonine protein kinase [Deltaproteobacteria bacterium]|nr:serine/threonine protein kinase [Deltaproteobacteria bacterium]
MAVPQNASARGFDTSIDPRQRYQIVGRIAAGGMAEIYLARTRGNADVEREVVLKRLLPELQTNKEFVAMFRDEARIAAQLSHPGIVQIYELGELDGSLFIAMELLRGINLRDLLARAYSRKKTIPLTLIVRVACLCLEALEYAHSFSNARGKKLNVVHRDVSPQNIVVTYEGAVKLVDFGVAKAEGRLHQTAAGMVKGKFAYMAPEQITGGRVDGRADLFALAEVIYEVLLRRHPFYAPTDVQVLRAIIEKDPPHPSDFDQSFPRGLGDILMKAMEKHRDKRFKNAGEMHEALESFLLAERTPATTAMLAKYLREAFADRLEAEQYARESGDDAQLIEVLTAGQAEAIAVLGEDGVKLMASRQSVAEPIETIAASEYEAPTQGGAERPQKPAPRQTSIEGEDDMPTMMGALTPDERAELAPVVEVRRPDPPPPKIRSSVAPPARPPAPAKATPLPPTAPFPVPDFSDPDFSDDTEGGDPRRPKPATPKPGPQSPRSPISSEVTAADRTAREKLGIWLFVTGLVALLVAIGAAVVLLTRPPPG